MSGPGLDERDVARMYSVFSSPVVAFDCGERCAASNGGKPFCCDDSHAIPVLYKPEVVHLKRRTEMWRAFRPKDDEERQLAADLPEEQRFARCKGHTLCERENRSFSCRTFPFYPYFGPDGGFFGLAYYWEYVGHCWILEKHDLVLPEFVRGFVQAWEIVFERLPVERDFFRDFSARARGTHTRLGRTLVAIDRAGKAWLRRPGTDALEPAPPGPDARSRAEEAPPAFPPG